MIDPTLYCEIPDNPHRITAGSLLFPTQTPIVAGGGTSLDFIHQQGGDDDTFIFMLGIRRMKTILGDVETLVGVFLSDDGPGFLATWDFQQLMRETDHGGWTVVPTAEVLTSWTERVEARMNKRK